MLSNLKQARLAANLSLDEVAQQLNIRKNYLCALEENNLANLPGEVYINGYLKLYAKFLKIDIPDIKIDESSLLLEKQKKKENRFKNYLIIVSLILLLAVILMYPIIIQYNN